MVTIYIPHKANFFPFLGIKWGGDFQKWIRKRFEKFQRILSIGLLVIRAFNAREGIDRKNDALPENLFKPLKVGASDGWKLDRADVELALENYFEFCGWDVRTCVPT